MSSPITPLGDRVVAIKEEAKLRLLVVFFYQKTQKSSL